MISTYLGLSCRFGWQVVPGTLVEGGAVRCVTPHAHLALTPPRPEAGDVAEVEVLPDGSIHLAFDAPPPPPPPLDSFRLPPTLLSASLLPRDYFAAFDYFDGPATHAVARAHCQQLGGDLASIRSQAGRELTLALARTLNPIPNPNQPSTKPKP